MVVGPQLAQERERPVGLLQREAPFYADYRSALATRSDGGGDAADVTPVDRTVGRQAQDVTGQHVHPTQSAPTLRPDRPLTMVSHGVGHLFSPHDRASLSVADVNSPPVVQYIPVSRANSTALLCSTSTTPCSGAKSSPRFRSSRRRLATPPARRG